MPNRLPVAMQTSTKVLEYLAVGLPVLSNDYPWARTAAAQHPGRIQLLADTLLPECWAQAMAQVPPPLQDRSHLNTLVWSEQLAPMTVWQALGLTKVGT